MSAPALRHLIAWVALLAALAGVFMLYTRPDFLVSLADQIWACF